MSEYEIYEYDVGTQSIGLGFDVQFLEELDILEKHYKDIIKGNREGTDALSSLLAISRKVSRESSSLIFCMHVPEGASSRFAGRVRCGFVTAYLCKKMGLGQEETENAVIAAYMYDCCAELLKGRRAASVTQRPAISYHALTECLNPAVTKEVREIILGVHECADGSGYPFGLLESQINKTSQLVRAALEIISVLESAIIYADDDVLESIDEEVAMGKLRLKKETFGEELYGKIKDILSTDPMIYKRGR